jgi:outer membrane protein
MKNVSLILNVVLVVAVAALFYLHFAGNKSQSTVSSTLPKDLKIAYVNSDSILQNYDYFKVNRDKLEAKGKKLDQDLQNRAQSLQGEIQQYQRNASTLTMGQARAVEEDLSKKRQNLEMYQQSLSQEIIADQEKVNLEIYKRVTDFLKVYGDQNGLQLVLKYNPQSDLLFANSAMDISKEVVAGLNEAFRQEQTSGGVAKDSVATKKK